MTQEEKKLWAQELLREKQEELGRLPKKEDFDDATRSRIKSFLGPWPRALEAAGLKEPKLKNPNPKKKKRCGSEKNVLITAMHKLEKQRAKKEKTTNHNSLRRQQK